MTPNELPGDRSSRNGVALAAAIAELGIECALEVRGGLALLLPALPLRAYDEADRDFFYGALAEIGMLLVRRSRPVIFDATANRRRYRAAARSGIDRFCEVHVDTPLAVCRARDPKGLYRSGRLADLVYEAPDNPELVLNSEQSTPAQAAWAIVSYLAARRWV